MMAEPIRKKKLIEVALPLDEINAACKAYKDRKVGTIRNLHKWFAAMPLPAWRALLVRSYEITTLASLRLWSVTRVNKIPFTTCNG